MAFTYEHVGATREGRCPTGFHPLRVRTRVGAGADVFRTAARAVLSWQMHRAVGVSIDAAAETARAGADVTVGLGWIEAPCRVVWTVEEENLAGFAYGTLAGHPECGEEAFLVERTADGAVWLTVTAFSRPVKWWVRAGGPLVRVLQRAYARRCGAVLRHICRSR
ncbi:DUF1990 family protein [Streptomyces sp. NPDC002577]